MIKWSKQAKMIFSEFKEYLNYQNCVINSNIDEFITHFIKENNVKTITENEIIPIMKTIEKDFCRKMILKNDIKKWCN